MKALPFIYLMFIIASFTSGCGQKSSTVSKDATTQKTGQNEISSPAQNGQTLKSGWYHISDIQTDYIRQLNKTDEVYFIDPSIIVSFDKIKEFEISETSYGTQKYPTLMMWFDEEGTALWADATQKAIGTKVGFILNNGLVYAPKVNSQITTGASAINSTEYSLEELGEILKLIKQESR